MKALNTSKTKIIVITAVSLAFVLLVISLAYFSNGFKFKQSGQTLVPVNESYIYDGDGNAMESGKVYPLSSNMIFSGTASLAAESSGGVTVKAKVIPDNATNKKVDWSVAWVNPSSAFANGKNAANYVKVTPAADGSLIAVVECLQAFGEKIQIIVSSRDNPNIKAKCMTDYMRRIENVAVNIIGSGLGDNSFVLSDSLPVPTIKFLLDKDLLSGAKVEIIPVLSPAYTLDDTFSYNCYVAPSGIYGIVCSVNGRDDCKGGMYGIFDNFFPGKLMAETLFGEIPGEQQAAVLRGLFQKCVDFQLDENIGSYPQLDFFVSVRGKYSSVMKFFPAWVDIANFKFPVSGVSLDTGSIVL